MAPLEIAQKMEVMNKRLKAMMVSLIQIKFKNLENDGCCIQS